NFESYRPNLVQPNSSPTQSICQSKANLETPRSTTIISMAASIDTSIAAARTTNNHHRNPEPPRDIQNNKKHNFNTRI
ncbi:hypothetical protein VIGAN_06116900, partial [Vigna angularis var. angularis]